MKKNIFQTFYKKGRAFLGNSWPGAYLKHRVIGSKLQQFQNENWPKKPVERSFEQGIAIVIPCYNHTDYLESTFTCLAHQTYRPFEVIFVEDHSTDNTYAYLKQLSSQLPAGITPTLIRTPKNSGQAFAINFGVNQANASLIMVLNDDDYLMHDALEAAVEILQHNSNLYLFGATSRIFNGYGCPRDDEVNKLIRNIYPSYTSIPLKTYSPADTVQFTHPNDITMTHSGSVFFKSAWQLAGGYYPQKSKRVVIFSDRDFQLRVAALLPVAVSMEVPFVYWRSDSSVDYGLNT